MNTLSIQRPRPSIEMRPPAAPLKNFFAGSVPWQRLVQSGFDEVAITLSGSTVTLCHATSQNPQDSHAG